MCFSSFSPFQVSLRGFPLLATVAALGCFLGLFSATELPWGEISLLDPSNHRVRLSLCLSVRMCVSPKDPASEIHA